MTTTRRRLPSLPVLWLLVLIVCSTTTTTTTITTHAYLLSKQPTVSSSATLLQRAAGIHNRRASSASNAQVFHNHNNRRDLSASMESVSTTEEEEDALILGDLSSSSSAYSAAATTPHFIFPGGGIFFYWQAGYMDYLLQQYDLSSVKCTGASAGALTATLTSCGVDLRQATTLALDLAQRANLWNRRGGLQGIWGAIIEEWLEELLPDDAATMATQHNLTLLLTPVPSFQKLRVSDYLDKNDLIQANLASVHIPWFLDGQWTTQFRHHRRVIDGSFRTKCPRDYYHPPPSRPKRLKGSKATFDASAATTFVVDYSMDPAYAQRNLLDAVQALSPNGIWQLLEDGRRFAQQHDEQGAFQCLLLLKKD